MGSLASVATLNLLELLVSLDSMLSINLMNLTAPTMSLDFFNPTIILESKILTVPVNPSDYTGICGFNGINDPKSPISFMGL